MKDRIGRVVIGALALGFGAALAAAPLEAKDVYRNYLDPALPHHRAILDTLEHLKAAPNDAGLHNDLGCLIAWDGFWRDALREFDVAAKLDNADSRPLFNAGLVQAWHEKWGAARSDFAKARRRAPGNWPAWWMLGYAEEKLGNFDAAVSAYKSSLRVDTSLFEVAKNPFAADTKLKARVLLETYERRLVRAAMPLREEFAAPERIASFFQQGGAGAPAAAAADEVGPAAPTGPVVTTAPPSGVPGPPSRATQQPNVVRPTRGRQPEPRDPNADQAQPPAPPDSLPFNEVTPAPKKSPRPPPELPPGPGFGRMPPLPQPTPAPEQ